MSFDSLTLPERLDELYELPARHARGFASERLVEQILTSIPGVKVAGRNIITGHDDEAHRLEQLTVGHAVGDDRAPVGDDRGHSPTVGDGLNLMDVGIFAAAPAADGSGAAD